MQKIHIILTRESSETGPHRPKRISNTLCGGLAKISTWQLAADHTQHFTLDELESIYSDYDKMLERWAFHPRKQWLWEALGKKACAGCAEIQSISELAKTDLGEWNETITRLSHRQM